MPVDWSSAESETVSLLQSLIRFDTTNPPGNELPLAEHLVRVLEADRIEARLLIPASSRAAVIARLRGNGRRRPVMLLAHMDVVGVEREKWSCDPFGGVVRDGYLYGRGAIDDKGMLAVNTMTMILLQRAISAGEISLDRDVVFVATSDEETGGTCGMAWLVANHRDLIDAEFAINEGGRIRIIGDNLRYVAVQTAEKISHMVTVTVRGPAGHAAIPLDANAIFRLGRALAQLGDYREPVLLTETTTRFFSKLSRVWPDAEQRSAMAGLVSSDRGERERAEEILSRVPVLNAVMRNGISATRIVGGVAGNVIPAEATAVLNVRTIPGERIEDIVRRLEECVGDAEVSIDIASEGRKAPASDPDSEMFEAIAAAATSLDSGMTVVPYLSTGTTDSVHLRCAGISAYGILPFPMAQDDEERMHGHDERVPLESLHFGTRLIYESIARVALAKDEGAR
ncbi:MAG TPA: M20/M25/M40 family metallo-hydrolase [Gemmatimonadaceae bacterium]|nr:M20/M25/M40 family metallo-hydrolase [Gemmatimonadaceae bacterium]